MAGTSRLGVYGNTVSGLSCGAGVPAGLSAFDGGADCGFCGVGFDGARFVVEFCANSEAATGRRATARAAAIRLMAASVYLLPFAGTLLQSIPFRNREGGSCPNLRRLFPVLASEHL